MLIYSMHTITHGTVNTLLNNCLNHKVLERVLFSDRKFEFHAPAVV